MGPPDLPSRRRARRQPRTTADNRIGEHDIDVLRESACPTTSAAAMEATLESNRSGPCRPRRRRCRPRCRDDRRVARIVLGKPSSTLPARSALISAALVKMPPPALRKGRGKRRRGKTEDRRGSPGKNKHRRSRRAGTAHHGHTHDRAAAKARHECAPDPLPGRFGGLHLPRSPTWIRFFRQRRQRGAAQVCKRHSGIFVQFPAQTGSGRKISISSAAIRQNRASSRYSPAKRHSRLFDQLPDVADRLLPGGWA